MLRNDGSKCCRKDEREIAYNVTAVDAHDEPLSPHTKERNMVAIFILLFAMFVLALVVLAFELVR